MRKNASDILQFSPDARLGAAQQLLEKYQNNGVLSYKDLQNARQQLESIAALPAGDQAVATSKFLLGLSGQKPTILNQDAGDVATVLETDEKLAGPPIRPTATARPQSTPKLVRVTFPDGTKKELTAEYVPGQGKGGQYFVGDQDITSLNPQLIDDPNPPVPSFSFVPTAGGIFAGNTRTGEIGPRVADLRPGDAAGRQIADARTLINLIKNIEDTFTPEKVGPITGRFKTLQEGITGKDADYAALAAQVNSLRNTTINLRTGAQMSSYEAQRILSELPGMNLPFKTFLARLKTSRNYFEEFVKNRESVAYGRLQSMSNLITDLTDPDFGLEKK
jgi:hypothetical protein